ncbi:uncharacterized protein [Aristolochia californica]|uniref:uncharacterized protein n=1 Tax=Aristolochia californica TaxID=171875 RepID=UPI0035D990F0
MGNSNVTGVPEQDSPRFGDVNKLTEVSKDPIDETVQEDQLLDLNLDHKAPKEPKAAEEIDNSILQQTCQDREEEEKEMTPVMVNARVQPMEQSPTKSEDLKSNEQEEALVIAAQVEDSIQQFGSEESNACSDIEGEEDSVMTNEEETELQDSLVADSSTGPTEKIQSGVDMVQMLNGVAVEYGSSSEFDKSQKDEPNDEPEKHELEFSETVILLHKKEGEQDQTEHPNDFDAENESTELDLDEAMESFYLEAIDSEMRTEGFEANKKEIEIPPETAPDRYYENATVNLEEESKENGEQRLESLPQNGEEKAVEKNATEIKSPEIITEELEDETVIQLTNKEGERDQTEQPIDFDAENESRELDLDEAIDSKMRTLCFEDTEKETEIPPETAPDRYYENATKNLEEDSKENGEQRLESLPQNGEEKEVEKNATEVKSPEIITEELEDETVIQLTNKEGERDQTEQPIDFDAENESTELDLDEAMESYLEAIDSEMRTEGFEANKKEIEIPPETAPDRYYENATVNLEEDSKENGEQILGSLPQNGEEKEVENKATEVKSPEIITEELEDETVIQLTNKEGERDQTAQPIDFDAENESRELDLDEAIESFYLEAIDSKMRTVCFDATEKETEIPPETAPDRYYENATVNLEEDSKENGEQILGSLPQNGEEKEVETKATEVKSPEIITEELEDETVIQLTNKEGERDQTEQPIDFDAVNKSRELDLDEAIESFYLEAMDSKMRTVCFEATEKETEIPPETAPDRYYENATVNSEEDSKENGEQILGSLPQNGEEKEVEKNATEVKSPKIITEELEDESDMIELSGSVTEFVILAPEKIRDVTGIITNFPELKESEGGELQSSFSSLSDSAADIDAEVLQETQNSDTEIEVTEDTDGSAPDYLNEAQNDNSSVTEDRERKSEEFISAFTDLIMEEEILANPPLPPPLLELSQELEQKIVVMETEKYDNPERFLSDFHEENQGDTENFELHRGPDRAEESEQAENWKDQFLEPEAKIDVTQSVSHSNSVMDTEQPETEGSLNTESNEENLETERISFDFQNPVPETRFPDVQSTKANFFSSHIFPQTVAVKTETSGVEGSHPDEDELVTKISIAKTEVLTPKTTKEERPEEAVLNGKSSSTSNGSAIKRSDAVKSKPPHLKEDDTVVSSLQRHETAAMNKTVDDAWESPDKKKIVATSPRVRRKQSKSCLFSSSADVAAAVAFALFQIARPPHYSVETEHLLSQLVLAVAGCSALPVSSLLLAASTVKNPFSNIFFSVTEEALYDSGNLAPADTHSVISNQ